MKRPFAAPILIAVWLGVVGSTAYELNWIAP